MTIKRRKNGSINFVLILILGLITFAGIGYFAYKNGQTSYSPIDPISNPNEPTIIDGSMYVDKYHPPIEGEELPDKNSDTSNWKAYKNEKYGFEFKYPESWFIAYETDSDIYITSTNPENGGNFAGFRVKIYSDSSVIDLPSLKKYIIEKYPYLDPAIYLSTITIDGVSTYKLIEDAAPENIYPTQYFLLNKGVIYQIEATQDLGFPERNENQTNNQILSTFKFLE